MSARATTSRRIVGRPPSGAGVPGGRRGEDKAMAAVWEWREWGGERLGRATPGSHGSGAEVDPRSGWAARACGFAEKTRPRPWCLIM